MSERPYPTNYPDPDYDPSLLAHEHAENTGSNLRTPKRGLTEAEVRKIVNADTWEPTR